MATIGKFVRKAFESEFAEGRIYRIDLDRVDVIPIGSLGVLRSLRLIGDRQKVRVGDIVRIARIAGERVALIADQAGMTATAETIQDAIEVELAEKFTSLSRIVDPAPDALGINADTLDGEHAFASISYTPEWGVTSGVAPSLGNAGLSGKYTRLGKLCIAWVSITMGSTTTFGSGAWYFTLPINATQTTAGVARLLDSGTSHYRAVCECAAGNNRVTFFLDSGSNVTATNPFTWAASDRLAFTLIYLI